MHRIKLILIASVLIFFQQTIYAEQPYSWPASVFPTKQPLGKVKTITETAYTMNDSLERRLKYTLILRYNREGQLESEEYYNIDGSPANRIDYRYEDGYLVLKTQSHPDIINPDREIYRLSKDGRILEAEKIFSKGNYGWKFRNSYNNLGQIVLTSKYDRYWKWQLVYSRMFEYDERGFLISTEGFGMKSELLWRDEHKYDEEGLCVESAKYNPDGEIVVRIINEYNEKGFYVRREFFDKDEESYAVYTYGWVYDEEGNWIEKIVGRECIGDDIEYLIPDSMISRRIEYYE